MSQQRGLNDLEFRFAARLKCSLFTIRRWRKYPRKPKTTKLVFEYWYTDGKLWYLKNDSQ